MRASGFVRLGRKWERNFEFSLDGKEKGRKFQFHFFQRKWQGNGKEFKSFASKGRKWEGNWKEIMSIVCGRKMGKK